MEGTADNQDVVSFDDGDQVSWRQDHTRFEFNLDYRGFGGRREDYNRFVSCGLGVTGVSSWCFVVCG